MQTNFSKKEALGRFKNKRLSFHLFLEVTANRQSAFLSNI
jgi:hypothetical protein